MRIVVIGLSITSSWGNGHATTYRSLLNALYRRGHEILFLEQDVPWYAKHRDLRTAHYAQIELYKDLRSLKCNFDREVVEADLCVVGSYVQHGIEVCNWVTKNANGVSAFYDIDTPVTIGKLGRQECEYLNESLIPRFDLYLSFTGGPILDFIERHYGSPAAHALYCSVDPAAYFPQINESGPQWDLGYMGTYSPDRQPSVDEFLLTSARRSPKLLMAIAGPLYPGNIVWPRNIKRFDHLPPDAHRSFYNQQRFTLNITRADMIEFGYSPSVRLFEAAACGTPIISDYWNGLDSFFDIGSEILVASSSEDVLAYLTNVSDAERRAIGERARRRVLEDHTSEQRAIELESYYEEVIGSNAPREQLAEVTQ
jgi:spore maturation protein CgeB